MADSGKWRELERILKAEFPNANITSTYRPGSTSGGNADYHSTGEAIDIAPPSMQVFNWIAQNYPQSTELIYTPAGNRQLKNGSPHKYSAGVAIGHIDHIHWAMSEGATITNASNTSGSSVNPLKPLADFVDYLVSPGTWKRIGLGAAGLVLIVFAALAFTGRRLAGMGIG